MTLQDAWRATLLQLSVSFIPSAIVDLAMCAGSTTLEERHVLALFGRCRPLREVCFARTPARDSGVARQTLALPRRLRCVQSASMAPARVRMPSGAAPIRVELPPLQTCVGSWAIDFGEDAASWAVRVAKQRAETWLREGWAGPSAMSGRTDAATRGRVHRSAIGSGMIGGGGGL